MTLRVLALLLAGLALASSASAQRLKIARVQMPIRIDGRLDEAAWNAADSATELTEIEPQEGARPSARTVIRVLTTGTELIIGIRADDPDPSRIVSFARQRDATLDSEDHLKIVLDPYLTGRSGYVFAVNPNGARYDALIAPQSSSESTENAEWDAIWEAATARTPTGWSVEILIPVKSLLFRPGLTEWGFNVQRRIQRLLETDRWAGPKRDYKVTQTSVAGRLTDLPRFKLGLGLSVRPSVTVGGAHDSSGSSFRNQSHGSLDVTQRVGANTLASLTVNTDFAETEVDTRRINLTRFPLFFPEKRTFFLEGSDIFGFGLGLGEELAPFFSRKIGLLEEQQVPIDAGAKVNGVIGGTSFGALAIHTGNVDTLTTRATMGVIRLKQNVLRESSIGIIATAGDPLGRAGSWLAGPDLTFQTSHFHGDKNLQVGIWGLAMGRSDLHGDRTAAGLTLNYPNDLWSLSAQYKRIGDGFDPSLGFVPRPGTHSAALGFVWSPRPTHPIGPLHIRQCFWENELTYVAGLTGGWQSYRYFMAPINCRLESGDRFEFNIVPTGERLSEPFDVAESVTIQPGAYHFFRFRLEAGLATKRKFNAQATWWFGRFYDGKLNQYEVTGAWKPSPLFIVEFTGEHDVGHVAGGDFVTDLLGTRLRLNVSPDLQLTSYLQYDSESDSFGSNTRLRWTFLPAGDLFLVYNHNLRTRDPLTLERTLAFSSNQLLLKLQYALRR